MNFLKRIFARPIAVCIIVIVCMAAGVLATRQMSTNLLPDITYPAIGVTVPYPGASAETCDEDVRPLIEGAVKTLGSVKTVTSYSIENASMCAIIFEYGTDLDKKTDELKDKLGMVAFPSACYDPIFAKLDFNGMAVSTVSVYNEGDVMQSIEDARALEEKLLGIENVASVTVVGMPEENISITPINGLEITTLLIAEALMTNSQLDIPLGSIVEDGKAVAFRNQSSAETVEEIKNTPIQMPITQSLAEVVDAAKELLEYVQNTPSSEMQFVHDVIYGLYSAIVFADVSTGAEMLEEFNRTFKIDDAIAKLEGRGYIKLSGLVRDLWDFVKEKAEPVLDVPANTLNSAQEEMKENFPEEFWQKFNAVIDFKKSHEYENPITGEVTVDELTPTDYENLLEALNMELPLPMTARVIEFLLSCDMSGLDYDSNGNAMLNLYIKDVADIKTEINYDSTSYYNSHAAICLQVFGVSGANTTAIAKGVKEVVRGEQMQSNVMLIDDQSAFINDSISNVLSSMIIGGILAVIVIYLFIRRLGASLIIAITMPLSVLAALICMYAMGLTLNMVSLGGLAVGIGMLVDNSIVVLEGISYERDKGKNAMQAALDGTRLVSSSLLASTLTSICVFFPILFTAGLTKMIFTDLCWSVIFSLTFSLIVALTVIPTLYCAVYSEKMMLRGEALKAGLKGKKKSLPEQKAEAEKVAEVEKVAENTQKLRLIEKVTALYDKLLRKALRVKWLVLGAATLLFASTAFLAFSTGTEFLPSVDQRTIDVKITFSASEQLDSCEEQTMTVYNDIYNALDKEIQSISVNVGKSGLIATADTGNIKIILNEKGMKTTKALDVVRDVVSKYDMDISVTEADGVLAALVSGLGGISNVSANISGEDSEVLEEIAGKILEKVNADYPDIKRISTTITDKVLEYDIKIDKMKCLEYGVDYTVAVATLRAGIAGQSLCTADIDGEKIDVVISFKDGTIGEYYDSINDFIIGINGDRAVTVGDVATITENYVNTVIKKENGKNNLTIIAEADTLDDGTTSKQLTEAINSVLKDYEGYTTVESGVNFYLAEVFDGLIVAIIASFLLLFAVMACQFESLTKPFIVIFAIPLSFTGGFLALTVTGVSLNVVSFVGLIMLMGVIVNDAIVMIDRIGQLEQSGMDRYTAIIEGTKARVRAIWMTTLTTVLALVPIALAIGKGSELMQPLGIVVIGGLLLGTIVTLVLIPCMYAIVKRVNTKNPSPVTPDGTVLCTCPQDCENEPCEATITAVENEAEEISVEEAETKEAEAEVDEADGMTATEQLYSPEDDEDEVELDDEDDEEFCEVLGDEVVCEVECDTQAETEGDEVAVIAVTQKNPTGIIEESTEADTAIPTEPKSCDTADKPKTGLIEEVTEPFTKD